ncbi:MAG: glycosyltransferase family 2 protein [Elusimicrobia bacterium]|nr:glycosyltransferase family 2 protein [Elusimicrobiota bacterium]
MERPKIPLSAVIITKNEEKNIAACIKSVSFADEIVVVDSRSTDKTVQIVESLDAKIFIEDWKGYGPQKNSAISKCRNQWVLVLDADERIPPETQEEIAETLKHPAADAYSFPRKNLLRDKWIKHAGFWPDRVIRLVKKNQGFFSEGVHEKWVARDTLKELKKPIEHLSFSGYSDMLHKLNSYSSSIAAELKHKGKTSNGFTAVFHGLGMFFKIYVLKSGFLEGLDGLVIALTKAGGSFFKYAKLVEFTRHNPKR